LNILLTNFHPNNGGGHTTYLHYIFREVMNRSDINIYIACPNTSKLYSLCTNISEDNTFDIDFPSKIKELGSVYINTKKLAKLIKKLHIDIVHVNGNPEHKMAMYCKIFYNCEIKIIRTKHDSKIIKNNFFTKLQYEKFMDRMIVVSEYQYKSLNLESIKDKIDIIHNGIDLSYFSPMEKNNDLLEKYNIKNNDIVFVSVAGTALYKGWQYLVEVISLLDNDMKSKTKIVLAGNSVSDKVFNKYIISKGMQNNIIFTGLVDDVRSIISIGDIGFVLSTNETISFACREMMSMGKPAIVSTYGGLPENINDNNDGWIVDIEDIELFKKLIEDIVNNIDIERFSKNAYNKAQEKFGLNTFLDRTLLIYKEVYTL
jgi:glycosyltransferase involved in cell wall biosynthesis